LVGKALAWEGVGLERRWLVENADYADDADYNAARDVAGPLRRSLREHPRRLALGH
jgi:hypothetical protein